MREEVIGKTVKRDIIIKRISSREPSKELSSEAWRDRLEREILALLDIDSEARGFHFKRVSAKEPAS